MLRNKRIQKATPNNTLSIKSKPKSKRRRLNFSFGVLNGCFFFLVVDSTRIRLLVQASLDWGFWRWQKHPAFEFYLWYFRGSFSHHRLVTFSFLLFFFKILKIKISLVLFCRWDFRNNLCCPTYQFFFYRQMLICNIFVGRKIRTHDTTLSLLASNTKQTL